jgi:hypothetical protein
MRAATCLTFTDIANLGLTLAEGKPLPARVRQEVVAAQVDSHAVLRSDCRSCNGRRHVKDWRRHRIATLCGELRVRLPLFICGRPRSHRNRCQLVIALPINPCARPIASAAIGTDDLSGCGRCYWCTCCRSKLARALRHCNHTLQVGERDCPDIGGIGTDAVPLTYRWRLGLRRRE